MKELTVLTFVSKGNQEQLGSTVEALLAAVHVVGNATNALGADGPSQLLQWYGAKLRQSEVNATLGLEEAWRVTMSALFPPGLPRTLPPPVQDLLQTMSVAFADSTVLLASGDVVAFLFQLTGEVVVALPLMAVRELR